MKTPGEDWVVSRVGGKPKPFDELGDVDVERLVVVSQVVEEVKCAVAGRRGLKLVV